MNRRRSTYVAVAVAVSVGLLMFWLQTDTRLEHRLTETTSSLYNND